jgi:hypothetical protein
MRDIEGFISSHRQESVRRSFLTSLLPSGSGYPSISLISLPLPLIALTLPCGSLAVHDGGLDKIPILEALNERLTITARYQR